MMNTMRKFSTQAGAVAITLMLSLSIAVTAAGAADERPQYGEYRGEVEYVDAKNNSIVVGDRVYHITPNTQVHRLAGNAPLSRGTMVEISIAPGNDPNANVTIAQLWIIGAKRKK
jgi:hypothetical protein